jgi:hypothetical protein
VWCEEFDRTEDPDSRRDIATARDLANKRRGDKKSKDEKVPILVHSALFGLLTGIVDC